MLAVQLEGVWAEEVLRSGSGGLSATDLGKLVLLATGSEKQAMDAATRRAEDDMIRDFAAGK